MIVYSLMSITLFLISLLASLVGAISGIGGGVIIKPILDSIGIMNVSTISFLSGCTVLTMTITSLIRNKKNKSGTNINYGVTFYLAIGSAFGGVIGKVLFDIIRNNLSSENIVGLIQSIILLIINIVIILYFKNKSNINTLKINNKSICILMGISLGVISSFLGIGGGPLNIALLYYFLSMSAKESTINSLFIIFFSQVTSLVTTLLTGNIPEFDLIFLVLMCSGGVLGGIVGSKVGKKMDDCKTENFFMLVLCMLTFINIFNIIKFI
ncbi:sulfite exporter TauE/SafE family protein [Clostridium paraputrificum]|uniref:sulfite exporter TauE/SafE family protein n=1 Tax=Clostridium TaxID=1485 RepID=UPI003D32C2C8